MTWPSICLIILSVSLSTSFDWHFNLFWRSLSLSTPSLDDLSLLALVGVCRLLILLAWFELSILEHSWSISEYRCFSLLSILLILDLIDFFVNIVPRFIKYYLNQLRLRLMICMIHNWNKGFWTDLIKLFLGLSFLSISESILGSSAYILEVSASARSWSNSSLCFLGEVDYRPVNYFAIINYYIFGVIRKLLCKIYSYWYFHSFLALKEIW